MLTSSKRLLLVPLCRPASSSSSSSRFPFLSFAQLPSGFLSVQSNRSFFASSDQHSHILDSTSTSLFDQLSAQLISHPFQPLSYTSSVILATLLVRSTTTLPISVWSRFRTHRFETIVVPKFKKFRTHLALAAKRKFLHPSQIPVYQAHLQSRLGKELKTLIKQHRCKPSTTILVSLGVHVPVIYALTTILREACQRAPAGSSLALETSPVLGLSLVEPDLGLALICWAGFLINVELNASFRHLRRSTESGSQPSNPTSSPASPNASFISRGLAFWNPEKIRTASFLAGIGMMGLSASQPALVVIYWLTSNCFSILQSLCFIYLDHRQKVKQANHTDQTALSPEKAEEAKISLLEKNQSSRLVIPLKSKSKSKSASSLPPIL